MEEESWKGLSLTHTLEVSWSWSAFKPMRGCFLCLNKGLCPLYSHLLSKPNWRFFSWLCRGSLDQSLKDTLKKFSIEKRFAYWSGYVKSLAVHVAETEGSSCTSLLEYQMLVSAWRMLLIIATTHVRPFWGEFSLWYLTNDVLRYLADIAPCEEELIRVYPWKLNCNRFYAEKLGLWGIWGCWVQETIKRSAEKWFEILSEFLKPPLPPLGLGWVLTAPWLQMPLVQRHNCLLVLCTL